MDVLFFLVPLAIVFAAGFVAAFVFSLRKGQFDDLETPRLRVLHDHLGVRTSTADGQDSRTASTLVRSDKQNRSIPSSDREQPVDQPEKAV